MGQYAAPLRDMQFVLHELLDVESELKHMPRHAEIDTDTVNQVIEEAGKFCADVLFPLNQSGDIEGCHWNDGEVSIDTKSCAAWRLTVSPGLFGLMM